MTRHGKRVLASALLAGAALACGACAGEEQVIGRGDQLGPEEQVCPAFVPGTNMLIGEWNADPEANANAARVMQIAGDSAAACTKVLTELYAACGHLGEVTGTPARELKKPPTIAQTTRACDDAVANVETLRTELMNGAAATIAASRTTCDPTGAADACVAECVDGATCQAFCTSASAWLAECPPAAVTITFDVEVSDDLQERWNIVEAAVGEVLAARARLGLATLSLSRLAEAPVASYSVDDDECVGVFVQSVTDSQNAISASNAAIGSLIRTLQISD